MKKAKMSVQQRKYFVERISKTINSQILDLRQQHASEVYDISEAAYTKYLKALKVAKPIKEYNNIKAKYDILSNKITSVYEEVCKTVEDPSVSQWNSSKPTMYRNMTPGDIDKGFRWACNETAKKNDKSLVTSTMIKKLQDKRDKAIDILHGVDEFADILGSVNNILKGTEVPRLGD